MTQHSYLSFQNVEKRFGESVAVDDFSLEVEQGEWVVLLGPSGCGKTTLLRLLSGLETLTAGRILLDETDMSCVKPKDRGISFVFQDAALFENLSVLQNLTFALKACGIPQEEQRKRINKWAEATGIKLLLDRQCHQLSGGEQQRVAITQALVQEKPIVVFDEPLSNLDAVTRRDLRSELGKLQRSSTFTAIYVTHDQVEAMALADRIAIMQHGQVVQMGSAEQLYYDPDTLFTGRFFGHHVMNTFSASKLSEEDWCRLHLTQTPDEVTIGVRPEHITLELQPPFDDASIYLEAEVSARRFLGPIEEFELNWLSESMLVTKGNTPSTPELKPGTKIIMNLPVGQLFFFDRSNERRIRDARADHGQ